MGRDWQVSVEIAVNYSQRDPRGKWEYKSTFDQAHIFFFFFTPAMRASFNNLPLRFTLGLISLRCIWDATDECITSTWGCDTQWNLHQGHFNAGPLWHVSDVLRISSRRVTRRGRGEVKDIVRNVEGRCGAAVTQPRQMETLRESARYVCLSFCFCVHAACWIICH